MNKNNNSYKNILFTKHDIVGPSIEYNYFLSTSKLHNTTEFQKKKHVKNKYRN